MRVLVSPLIFVACQSSSGEDGPSLLPCPNAVECMGDYDLQNPDDLISVLNCDRITGHLSVRNPAISFLDVQPFECLREIGGDLTIENSAGDIHGFVRLETVGRDLWVMDLFSTEMTFTSLSKVGRNMSIIAHSATNLDGFSSIEEIGGSLNIRAQHLEDYDGLENLRQINGDLLLEDLQSIDSMMGLSNIIEVMGSVRIDGGLRPIDGFLSIERIGINLSISDTELVELSIFPVLDRIGYDSSKKGGVVFIDNNAALVSLSGLSEVSEMSGVEVSENTSLCQSLVAEFCDLNELSTCLNYFNADC